MARWKSLLLAGAFGCWPALGFAQVNPPSPPTDLGIPALPPGANTTSVPVVTSSPMPVSNNAPGRVTLSDRGGMPRQMTTYAGPDVSGMPKAESMYSGQAGMPVSYMGDKSAGFAGDGCGPQGLNFFAGTPVGAEPCGSILPACGPQGWLLFGGVNFYKVRRSDPSILFQTAAIDEVTGALTLTSIQEDYRQNMGSGYFIGTGYLGASGWFSTATYRHYSDTVHSDRIVNDGTDPNLVILYTGPGPLGSGAGGGDVPVGGFLDRTFDIDWRNLDVMAGVVISPANCLDVIFTAGVRMSKLDQNYDALIDFGDGTSNGQELRSELEGIGPRIGLETRIYPCWPFMLYAKAHTSLLFTHREESARITFVGFEATNVALAQFNRSEVMPSLELAIGGEASLFGGRVLIGGGYEFNYLYEAGSTYTEQSTNPRSARHVNLVIDGLVGHITFLF